MGSRIYSGNSRPAQPRCAWGSVTILDKILGGQKKEPENVDIYLFKSGSPRLKVEEGVSLDKDYVELDGHRCNINPEDLCHNGGDLRLFYDTKKSDPRGGGLEPLGWQRFSGKINGADIYGIEHDISAFEGVMNMLGVGGAGTLKKQHWLIIIAVVVVGILAMFYLRPYLPI